MAARLLITLCCVSLFGCSPARVEPLKIGQGESIAFIGNTFAAQMHRYGFFETLLHSRFGPQRARVRNLAWSADEITVQPRPLGFGDHHKQLSDQQASLIFACFGLNESFRGAEHLPTFRQDLADFLRGLLSHKYNETSAPRVVLVSPIAHETNPDHNKTLKVYVAAMAEVAKAQGVRFVDLLAPTLARMDAGQAPLTYNGVHLTQSGYWTMSKVLAERLGWVTDPGSGDAGDDAAVTALRRLIVDKNRAFFQHWHGPNMEYVHGRRNQLPGAEGLPAERSRLMDIIAAFDDKIAVAAKPPVAAVIATRPPALPIWATPPDYHGLGSDVPRKIEIPERHRIASPASAQSEFITAEGYKIELFASEDDAPIANPVAAHFDTKGRLWVACSPTWPHPVPGESSSDSIVILEDTDSDGKVDRHTVFAEQLKMIHGFALGNGGAYISQTPDIIFAADTDGDSKADRFETVLHGFGGEDVEHSINNLRWGPDGALYFMEGIFHHSQVETPYGPRRVQDGGMFRFDPRTRRLDIHASYAFWNPWGQAFDPHGLQLILDASSHDYFPVSTLAAPFRYPKNKHNKHAQLSFAPGGLGPAAGIELVRSPHFPDEAQGRLLANQLSTDFRGTRWFDLRDKGTTFEAQQLENPLVFSTDNRCRPLSLTFGPDGALYILDFASGLIENTSEAKRDPGRDHGHGRVWRLTYPARPLQEPAQIEGATLIELLDMLESADGSASQFARRALQEGEPDAVMQATDTWLSGFAAPSGSPSIDEHRLQALWIQQGLGKTQDPLLKQVLNAGAAPIRAAGLRTLRYRPADASFDELLKKLVADPDPRVRLEAVLACGTSDSPQARELALLTTRLPMDTGMRHVLAEVLDYLQTRHPQQANAWPSYPQGQAYLISRMSNNELIQRADSQPSEVALTQLAMRASLDPALRSTICARLAELRKVSITKLVYDLLLETGQLQDANAQTDLATMLVAAPEDQLAPMQEQLIQLTSSTHPEAVRQAGFASLLATGKSIAQVQELAGSGSKTLIPILHSIDLMPEPRREHLYPEVVALSVKRRQLDAIRGAAIQAMAVIPGDHAQIFNSIVGELTQGTVGAGARALFRFPRRYWQTALAARTLDGIFEFLDAAPERERDTIQFKESLRAAFELAQFLPADKAEEMHARLTALGPFSVTIRAIPHLMLFDKTQISVEAGKRVEITLENPGVMDHNIVIAAPGTLAKVGSLADNFVGTRRHVAGGFVPDSPDVLAASDVAAPRSRATLAFDAPSTPGDYPFLCTIPGHWSRMNGVLKVVAKGQIDTSSYSKAEMVRSWRTEDVTHILKKRGVGDAKAGDAIFTRLCSACHKVRGTGGVIGPDLTEASTRLSLTEMIEHTVAPAKQINPDFQIHEVLLITSNSRFGRIVREDEQAVYLLENPAAADPPRKIWRKDIIRMTPSKISTMPGGLLNTLKRRQILDLMAYIRAEK